MTKIINPNTSDFVTQSHSVGIDKYIGENPANVWFIEQTILNNRAVLIDAPTNSGKSTVMGDLFRKWINEEHRRCYYLLPKIIQQHQFEKKYLNGFPLVNSRASEETKLKARQLGGNITWQGFLSGEYDTGMTERDIVIVDESHLLVNNQSFIGDTKQLVRKLQQKKYKVVLMSGTPNYIALKDLFQCEILSFHLNTPQVRRIQPYIIDGKLMDNVTHYLRSLDFSGDGLHIIRVNDKDKHNEIKQWAVESLNLAENQVQIINKDIADHRWISDDYQFLIKEERIDDLKKLLITTIFADEGINVNNTNIKSVAIFYDPRLKKSSQRCRDSVIQFCSRFRYLYELENNNPFSINLFLPKMAPDRGTHDFFDVLKVQEKSAKKLLHLLIDTRKNHTASMVMQSFPKLFDGTDPQANLVIEVGDAYFEINRQGIYFNTKSLVDYFKSNDEFLTELSAYFKIDPVADYFITTKGMDDIVLKSARENRMSAKIVAFKPLKYTPDDVLSSISKQEYAPEELQELGSQLSPNIKAIMYGINRLDPILVKSIEEDTTRLLFLKSINFPINEFAGLLLHKHEFHSKMRFLRFMLSRAAGTQKSMDNLYFVSFFEPLMNIIRETEQQFIGQGFQPKAYIIGWITRKLPYFLKTKRIDAHMILDELFEINERRILVKGKKVKYVEIVRQRDIIDVTYDFLLYNEQYFPTIDEIKPIAAEYTQRQQTFNIHQGEYRNEKTEQPTSVALVPVGKARVAMDKSKKQLRQALMSNPTFLLKSEQVVSAMVESFKNLLDEFNGITRKLDILDFPEQMKPLDNAA